MPNGINNQACVKCFDCETLNIEKAVNMFVHMEISDTIYEVVVEYY